MYVLYIYVCIITIHKINSTNYVLHHNKDAIHILLPVQVTPLPTYPDLQAHVNPPCVFVHAALESQLFPPSVHSSTSETRTEHGGKFPKPPKDLHSKHRYHILKLKLHQVLQHTRHVIYVILPVQVAPLPVYPELQAQLNSPSALVHAALVSQL